MMKQFLQTFLFALLTLPFVHANEDPIKVFIDCRTNCDQVFYQQQIGYVDYVRDQNMAGVHVLITAFPMASGGRKYEISFLGKNEFEGMEQQLTYEALPMITSDERRKQMVQKLKLGLVSFMLKSNPNLDVHVKVRGKEGAADKKDASLEEDPWKHWVFETYVNGNANIQKSQRTFNWRLGGEISHVTEKWRILQNAYYNNNTKIFIDEEESIRSILQRYGTNGRIVRSIDDHWSAGIFESFNHSTFSNLNASVGIGPALEYSLFPYQEVTFREITIAYFNRIYFRDYLEETLYGMTEERLWDQSIRISARFRKPWGSLFSSLQGRHYFHDFSKNSLAFNNRLNLQVFRGLALNMTCNFEFINDQLHLPKGEASLEDILLQQRSVSTDFEFYFALGVAYTFGSIFNNVINTRL